MVRIPASHQCVRSKGGSPDPPASGAGSSQPDDSDGVWQYCHSVVHQQSGGEWFPRLSMMRCVFSCSGWSWVNNELANWGWWWPPPSDPPWSWPASSQGAGSEERHRGISPSMVGTGHLRLPPLGDWSNRTRGEGGGSRDSRTNPPEGCSTVVTAGAPVFTRHHSVGSGSLPV